MIIYLSFFQSIIQHPIPAYSFWEYYIKNGIEEAGYEWTEGEVDWAEGLIYSIDKSNLNKWKTLTWEKTLKDIKQKHAKKPISVFLSYLYPHQVDEHAIKEIQKLGIPCVNFFCDNVRDFTTLPEEFAVFDLNWVPEFKALEMYKNAKYNYIHLPMPMWVEPKYRNLSKIETSHISFIGSKDIQRWMLFEKLANDNKLDLKIMGAGWENKNDDNGANKIHNNCLQTFCNQIEFINSFGLNAYFRKLQQKNIKLYNSQQLQNLVQHKPDFEKYIKITKESVITLGVNRYPSYLFPLNNPNTYSRLRDIEAPMLGACYLTEWTEGIDHMYDIGKEIETYKDSIELIEKINYLKKNKLLRIELRTKGQFKALNDHNIITSIDKLKSKLNIP